MAIDDDDTQDDDEEYQPPGGAKGQSDAAVEVAKEMPMSETVPKVGEEATEGKAEPLRRANLSSSRRSLPPQATAPSSMSIPPTFCTIASSPTALTTSLPPIRNSMPRSTRWCKTIVSSATGSAGSKELTYLHLEAGM